MAAPVRPGSADGADARGGLPLGASPSLAPAPPRAAELLRTKVKFDLEIARPEDFSGNRENPFGDGFEQAGDEQAGPDRYIIQPAPWHSHQNPDPDQRIAEIVEGARLKLDEHFESARLATRASSSAASSTSTCSWAPARR